MYLKKLILLSTIEQNQRDIAKAFNQKNGYDLIFELIASVLKYDIKDLKLFEYNNCIYFIDGGTYAKLDDKYTLSFLE